VNSTRLRDVGRVELGAQSRARFSAGNRLLPELTIPVAGSQCTQCCGKVKKKGMSFGGFSARASHSIFPVDRHLRHGPFTRSKDLGRLHLVLVRHSCVRKKWRADVGAGTPYLSPSSGVCSHGAWGSRSPIDAVCVVLASGSWSTMRLLWWRARITYYRARHVQGPQAHQCHGSTVRADQRHTLGIDLGVLAWAFLPGLTEKSMRNSRW